MADRLPQFPLLSTNYTPSIMQQQQMNQAQQQAQADSQPVPGFPNPENGRIWQQMQQLQNQSRFQNGGELPGVQVNQQMADLIRSQNLARAQQMGQQQQFGLGASPMNAPSQSSPFHDHPSQPNQAHMSPNFANMNMQTAQIQSRNAALLAYANQNRQLELMGLAQNQQNGTTNFSARLAQQQQQQQQQQLQGGMNASQTQADMFSSPAIPSADGVRGSSAHLVSQQAGMMGGQPSQITLNGQPLPTGRRPMTLSELVERAQQLQRTVNQYENAILQLQGRQSEVGYNLKMQSLTTELKAKKESYAKVVQALTAQGIPAGGNMNAMGVASLPNHRNVTINDGQGQPTWAPQGTSQGQGFSGAQAGNTSQTQNTQPGSSQLNTHANHMMGSNTVPSRSVQTPHQLVPGQFPNRMSPNMNQFSFQMNSGSAGQTTLQPQNPSSQLIPPLEKSRFDSAYANYCSTKGISHDTRLMSVDGRPIDLHSLHVCVMAEGGGDKVNQKELWSVIGARMGFVQFPGSDSEPAKSGPGVAQHLAHVYKQYLSVFDNFYTQSVLESKRKLQQETLMGQAGASTSQAPRNVIGAQQMQSMLAYASLSAAELRSRGISEKIIQFVENHRTNLQRTARQQQAFRGILKSNHQGPSGQQPPNQDRTPSNGQGPFAGNLQQQNAALVAALPHTVAHPQQYSQQHQAMTGINNMDTQFRTPQGPMGVPSNAQPQQQPTRPSQEQIQQAVRFITKVKNEFLSRSLLQMPTVNVRDDQRMDYNTLLEHVHRLAADVEPKLAMYCIILKREDVIHKLIAIITTVQQQRSLLSSATPKYIVDLGALRDMAQQMRNASDMFSQILSAVMSNSQQATNGHLTNGLPPNGLQRHAGSPTQASPQPAHHVPPLTQTSHRPPPVTQHPLPKKKAPPIQPGPNISASSPTPPPAPSASTPVANALTPTPAAPSPQTPKSPRPKTAVKPKAPLPAKRKVSTKATPPTPETPQPSTPGVKRLREDDTPSNVSGSGNDHSPKRIKTEWDDPPSEELSKRKEQAENVKTEEDASAFFEQMSELIKLAATGEGQESLTSDISETLDMILKGYSSAPDAPEASGSSLMSLGLGDAGPRDSSPPRKPSADEFVEFFDFSSFSTLEDDDAGSKAPTPDLVSSSSANPSPGSEADATGHTSLTDIKSEDTSEVSDPLRLGPWKEIDGGESAYYQSDNWKWDGPMSTLDQPWAIFNTS
jgi:hypothetical protein